MILSYFVKQLFGVVDPVQSWYPTVRPRVASTLFRAKTQVDTIEVDFLN